MGEIGRLIFVRTLRIGPFSDRSDRLFTFISRSGISKLLFDEGCTCTFRNGLHYCTSDLKPFICNGLATSCKKFGGWTSVQYLQSLRGWKAYIPRRTAVWLRSLGGATARLGRDQYWVFWDDDYRALFHIFARGPHCYATRVTRQAVPRISWRMTLTLDLDSDRGQGEPVCQRCRSKVIDWTQRHTHRTNCSTSTTVMVGKNLALVQNYLRVELRVVAWRADDLQMLDVRVL